MSAGVTREACRTRRPRRRCGCRRRRRAAPAGCRRRSAACCTTGRRRSGGGPGARVVYAPATIHDEMSAWVSAPRTVQSACVADRRADAEDRRCRARSCRPRTAAAGVSNEPVVSRLTWPENGVSAKKLVADARRRADRAARKLDRRESAVGPRRRRRDRPAVDVLQDAAARVAQAPGGFAVIVRSSSVAGRVRRLRRVRQPGCDRRGRRQPADAGREHGCGPAPPQRDGDESRPLARTWTSRLRARRDEAGEMRANQVGAGRRACGSRSGRSRSVTANDGRRAERRDHRAGDRHARFVLHDAVDRARRDGRREAVDGRGRTWAQRGAATRPRSIRPPTTADASTGWICLPCVLSGAVARLTGALRRVGLRAADREVHVPRQRLVRRACR